jgi:hypothetical protein
VSAGGSDPSGRETSVPYGRLHSHTTTTPYDHGTTAHTAAHASSAHTSAAAHTGSFSRAAAMSERAAYSAIPESRTVKRYHEGNFGGPRAEAWREFSSSSSARSHGSGLGHTATPVHSFAPATAERAHSMVPTDSAYGRTTAVHPTGSVGAGADMAASTSRPASVSHTVGDLTVSARSPSTTSYSRVSTHSAVSDRSHAAAPVQVPAHTRLTETAPVRSVPTHSALTHTDAAPNPVSAPLPEWGADKIQQKLKVWSCPLSVFHLKQTCRALSHTLPLRSQ